MSKQIKQISIDNLDTAEFAVSYPIEKQQLVDSIRKVGLIQPLVVYPKDAAYHVICGYRRLWAAGRLGFSSIDCIIIERIPPLETLKLAIYDNLSIRKFNIIEKSNIINKLLEYLPPEKVITEYLPLLGLAAHYKILNKFLAVFGLKEKVKQAVAQGAINEDIAYDLSKWPKAEQISLANIFKRIPFSASNQRQIISLIWEISRREDKTLSDVLGCEQITGLLSDTALGNPQKAQSIKQYLKQRRYPKLNIAEGKFNGYIKAIKLPAGTKLIPPAYFEGGKFRLECSFSTPEQLHDQLLELEKLGQKKVWQDIFKLDVT